MKKVLFVATVVKTHINLFHLPFLKMFKDSGWETAVCARNDFEKPEDCHIPHCDKFFEMPFERFPFKPNNIRTLLSLRKLIKDEQYDIIHCHTPSGGVLARLAAIGTKKKGCRVMYTAHGFHFFKGAPLLNWLVYFPIEWVCSFFTDTLITINQEDYAFAKKHMHAKETVIIPGIGLDTTRFLSETNREEKRRELGFSDETSILLSIGELIPRKNHKVIIDAVSKLNDKSIHYIIVGRGEKKEELEAYIKELGLEDNIHLLGFRTDVVDLCRASDIFCFPSLQEGLGMATLEAMAAGIPCIASNVRGTTELIEHGKNGFLCDRLDSDDFARHIKELLCDKALAAEFVKNSAPFVQKFSLENSLNCMKEIYRL